jgi:hypothetical protein
MMNPIKRLWQWYQEWQVARQALKGRDVGGPNPSQGTPPHVDHAEDPRTRLLKGDPGPRIN